MPARFIPFFMLLLVAVLGAALPHEALAQTLTLDLGGGSAGGAATDGADGGGTVTGRVIQLVALLTVLSIAPGILIMMTSFTRIVIVLSFLRTAIGIQQTPPNTVMISLALFLTFFIMAPTFTAAYNQGIAPLINEEVDEMTAFEQGTAPFKRFMLDHVREKDLQLFVDLNGGAEDYEEAMELPLQVVIPAFMISELRRAFEIGFLIFLPFLVIDLVIATVLMAMGMMMLPPVIVSLPFKLVFFVLVDGWNLLTGSLVRSFGV